MSRFIKLIAMTAITIIALSSITYASERVAVQADEPVYEVLSPWAGVDPIPVRGLSARIDSISGKKIGLFANFKRAARPIMAEVEKRLKERFPDVETFLFDSTLPNVTETETVNKEKFTAWAKGVDAVIAAVGD
ncbi:MAG: hypothetical protein JW927_05560 [Deltaproteobacteria bacterium]|nr:hypothetical protein [Deltaproteobacteria bacterium]